MPRERIGIPEAVENLRSELVAAMNSGTGQHLRFSLDSVEVELTLAMERETATEAGVNVWVVSIGGKGSATSETTHRVKLSMTPHFVLEGGGSDPVLDEQQREKWEQAGIVLFN